MTELPTLNAVLNAISALFLTSGYIMIRHKKVSYHRAFMVAALIASVLFLTSYLFYHYHAGSKRFPGTGWVRIVYFSILISHTILAAIVPPMAIVTVYRAVKGQIERHRRIARWTLPIWLYVSFTGVVVYWMLYRMRW